MSIQINTQKADCWQETAERISRTVDKLGLPVDKGIKETVIVLNALGISTRASCEGHLDSGTCAPWVDIASSDPRADVSIVKLSEEAQQECNRNKKTEQEIRAIFAEVHKARRAVKAYHMEERRMLMAYLAEFYENRRVPYDHRLIIRPLGTDGKSRLESQGADCQEVADLEEKAQKLAEYQEEMRDFTAFLKQIFFYS